LLNLKFTQSPTNVGYRGLEFAKGSLALLTVSPLDLRVAGRFTQLQAAHLASSLSAAARNITKIPANSIRYPSGSQMQLKPYAKRLGQIRVFLSRIVD
jgi:hypothetical protein